MIQVEGVINFKGYQVRVWKTVSEKEQTIWYTNVVLDETRGISDSDFFLGVSGTSRGHVMLETGMRLQQYLDSK